MAALAACLVASTNLCREDVPFNLACCVASRITASIFSDEVALCLLLTSFSCTTTRTAAWNLSLAWPPPGPPEAPVPSSQVYERAVPPATGLDRATPRASPEASGASVGPGLVSEASRVLAPLAMDSSSVSFAPCPEPHATVWGEAGDAGFSWPHSPCTPSAAPPNFGVVGEVAPVQSPCTEASLGASCLEWNPPMSFLEDPNGASVRGGGVGFPEQKGGSGTAYENFRLSVQLPCCWDKHPVQAVLGHGGRERGADARHCPVPLRVRI
mmetsp:Transcript_2412/g.5750  ORF Transcript_2412/g.5750 Transcript_2412/m.5750 type:complete len:269 (+) Transcript_2412:1003-1809(+)